ncbi:MULTISPECIES: flagellar type III secretion system pore protein FliP [Paenibacillus]|jgi:flagellar biosynthetic protein FliP|uniref:Flagellar biosynthetic protein FliP n=1 Tax=Paenibacillus amylolyticus TaxID=1451 RepID=A0ABD8AYV9_PAEAM|nr:MULTISPECIES: flagellar type III secretion system pore protein FliP [Paenibacillus]APO45201.1 flagellar biosynthetic protein FliP [Paenibacillus xylanexedens]ETT37109.1 flagellar transport protein FliP [Paenibacillus sp. FSL R5-192]ETT52287.1 flagellar transport protein FliP [Paenibacillus sp. FSL H7-689]KAA8746489.1 flagellar type III secretion system pore protein FliP [Paenibacillus sp. UASWS1643]MBD8838017.1 flagellar type III secretion system pore protein FliP [Paenibacillus sp. CFBP 13
MKKKIWLACCLLGLISLASVTVAFAEPIPNIDIQIGNGDGGTPSTSSLSIILLITVLSIAPAMLVLMTSFTRIVIVLGFIRTSLGTQQMPPNQVLVGLALFLTLFIMSPTLSSINQVALQPYLQGELTQTEALEKAADPMKKFMFSHTREKDLLLFMKYNQTEQPKTYQDIPITVMVPAYVISELKTAFQMGFMIFIPFLVIDIVVASTLMAMGMMMLPPVMISLPFKILLFVLVDGWYLVVKSLLLSFNT